MIFSSKNQVIENKNKISGIIFYGSALCNLSCSYCYISKNNTLTKIDNEIQQMFKDKTYMNFLQEVLEKTDSSFSDINRLEFWGGEPFLGIHNFLDNCEPLLDKIVLQKVSVSSNFVSHKMLENTFKFFEVFNAHGRKNKRPVTIDFQISIDGDTNITDCNRGTGVTKQLSQNFREILKHCEKYPYLKISFHTKPTLSIENLHNFNSYQDVINYYQSFIDNLGVHYKEIEPWNTELLLTVPNFVTPLEYTKADGELWNNKISFFIDADKKIKAINNEDFNLFYFKHCYSLVPFVDRALHCNFNNELNKQDLAQTSTYCGSFVHNVVLMPNGSLGACHHSIYDLYQEYLNEYNLDSKLIVKDKENYNSKVCFNVDEFITERNRLSYLYDKNSISRIMSIKNLLTLYADCGLIYPIYNKESDNNNLARFVFAENNCVYYHIKKFSSFYVHDGYSLLLWGNGAFEKLLNYILFLKEKELPNDR